MHEKLDKLGGSKGTKSSWRLSACTAAQGMREEVLVPNGEPPLGTFGWSVCSRLHPLPSAEGAGR